MSTSSPRAQRAVSASVAIGVIACGVCCAIPFALPAVVLASTGGVLAWLAQGFWWARYLAFALVAGAWLWVGLEARRTHRRPARSTLIAMTVITAALAALTTWPLMTSRWS